MKRSTILSAVAGLLLAAAPAFADLTSTIKVSNSYGTTGAGEYLITYSGFDNVPVSLGTDPHGRFETFCLERNERLNRHSTFYVDFTDGARNGGAGGPNPDPISNETAFLYSEFISGDLDSYIYDTSSGITGRVRSANALQNAIWYLEQEITNKYNRLNGTEKDLLDQFLADAYANAGDNIGMVRAMNVYKHANQTCFAQDLLVMFEEPEKVPAPGAVALGMLGLSMTGWARRRYA